MIDSHRYFQEFCQSALQKIVVNGLRLIKVILSEPPLVICCFSFQLKRNNGSFVQDFSISKLKHLSKSLQDFTLTNLRGKKAYSILIIIKVKLLICVKC